MITITIDGQPYPRRNQLVVLGLTVITLGIYGYYWYYQANKELKRFGRDDSISPTRSLLAVIPGFLLLVPPFIAFFNTANHVLKNERRFGISSQISPALTTILALVASIGIAPYVHEHMNGIWDAASMHAAPGLAGAPQWPIAALPPPPPPPGC
jgi:hypothetical protein